MKDLINTTEMFLRTIYEMEEEGVPPLRARIVERLEQSGPTVSQTIARMERDGLVDVAPDRQLRLTPTGHTQAVTVMRRHRLAECLLIDVIGLELEHVHREACRWEHVMSEAVERKIFALLGGPTVSPHGNPIPGLEQIASGSNSTPTAPVEVGLVRLDELARRGGGRVRIRRIGEHVQADTDLMAELTGAGIVVDFQVEVEPIGGLGDPVPVSTDTGHTSIPPLLAHAVLVRPGPD